MTSSSSFFFSKKNRDTIQRYNRLDETQEGRNGLTSSSTNDITMASPVLLLLAKSTMRLQPLLRAANRLGTTSSPLLNAAAQRSLIIPPHFQNHHDVRNFGLPFASGSFSQIRLLSTTRLVYASSDFPSRSADDSLDSATVVDNPAPSSPQIGMAEGDSFVPISE